MSHAGTASLGLSSTSGRDGRGVAILSSSSTTISVGRWSAGCLHVLGCIKLNGSSMYGDHNTLVGMQVGCSID